MKVPTIVLKTMSYLLLSVSLLGAAGLVSAEDAADESDNAMRVEIKAALGAGNSNANQAARSVSDAIAAEIIASGLKTLILKQCLDSDSRPSKVAEMQRLHQDKRIRHELRSGFR